MRMPFNLIVVRGPGMSSTRHALLAACCAAAFAAPAARGHEVVPDHGKVATEEATPVGDGALEVELSYVPSRKEPGGGSFERAQDAYGHAIGIGVFYGVTEHLDVKVGYGFASVVDGSAPERTAGSGSTDLVLGSRWRFVADAARALDLTLATTVVAPTGAEAGPGITQGYWSLRNALVASKDWGRLTANAELALTVPVGGGAGELVGCGGANLAAGYAVSWVQPIAELNYEAALDGLTRQRLALTLGTSVTSPSGQRIILGVQRDLWGRNVTRSTLALVAAKAAF